MRLFCIGRGNARNPSGRVQPMIPDGEQYSEQQPLSPMSAKSVLSDLDEDDLKLKNSQSKDLIKDSRKWLSRLYTLEDITPSKLIEDYLPSYIFEIWNVVTLICSKMTEVQGCMLTLEDIININKTTEPFEVEVTNFSHIIFAELLHPYGDLRSDPRIKKLYFKDL